MAIEMADKETVGRRLRNLRFDRALTQKEVCAAVGIKQTSSYRRWEKGKFYPSSESVAALVKFFGVSEEDILSKDSGLSDEPGRKLFVKNLQSVREAKRLSKTELGRRAGLPYQTVKNAEGGRSIRFDTARLLAEALEVPVEELW